MATLIDSAQFTSNEVYQIVATDPVEGAANGASFNGTGISNQPHQQLANRTAYLKQRQDVNISSIGALQTFMAGFTGKMQSSGYIEIPITDVNRGAIAAIVQWGNFFPTGGLDDDQSYTIAWPVSFPNSCLWSLAGLADPTGDTNDVANTFVQVLRFSRTQGLFLADVSGGGQSAGTGFYWAAIGF